MFGAIPDFNQSLEMLKTMWGQTPGQNSPFMPDMSGGVPGFNNAMPSFNVDEIEKRIKDLKSVESWLTLNLNVLHSTIQGLEVQRATLLALKSFGDAMQPSDSSKKNTAAQEARSKARKSAKSRREKAADSSSPDAKGD
ncbi:MAG: hypothetical protein JHC80_02630 [Polynucleobacter sp.]|jgi:hypothetical protein|nr:hypothetical protein [Polynucleobacter sp.]